MLFFYALVDNLHIINTILGNLCRCTGYRPIIEGFRSFTGEYKDLGCGRTDCCQLKKSNINGLLLFFFLIFR